MATPSTSLTPAPEPPPDTPAATEAAIEAALSQEEEEEAPKLPHAAARLAVELDVSVAVAEFRLRDLLRLAPGQLIETHWASGQDVPLAAGRVQLAWTEFEVVDSTLAVRVTRLA